MAHVPWLLAAARGPRDTFGFTTVPSDEREMGTYVGGCCAPTRRHGAPLRDGGSPDRPGRGLHPVSQRRVLGLADGQPLSARRRRARRRGDRRHVARPSAQRTGINTEAKLLMLTHAFETWRVHRVSLVTDARNARSRNAILRLGARFDGILRAARVAVRLHHPRHGRLLHPRWRVARVKARLAARLHQVRIGP